MRVKADYKRKPTHVHLWIFNAFHCHNYSSVFVAVRVFQFLGQQNLHSIKVNLSRTRCERLSSSLWPLRTVTP